MCFLEIDEVVFALKKVTLLRLTLQRLHVGGEPVGKGLLCLIKHRIPCHLLHVLVLRAVGRCRLLNEAD